MDKVCLGYRRLALSRPLLASRFQQAQNLQYARQGLPALMSTKDDVKRKINELTPQQAKETAQQVTDKASQYMTDAENKVKEMWNQDDSTTGKAKDWANEKAEQTKNMGNEASKKTDNMREEAGKKADDAGHEIRKHP